MAGGVALNCVANSRLHREGPFDRIWVQPAAGDAGTALGAALSCGQLGGARRSCAMPDAYLGRGWTDDELEAWLKTARWPYERPASVAGAVAAELAADGIVAWFQGRSEFGPRALGSRSLLAHPGRKDNLDRLNAVKGREEFRPVAPMVLADRAASIFQGPLPSPYMLFVHTVDPAWREKIPAVVHVDGTARVQTVDRSEQPLLAEMLEGLRRAHRVAGGREHQPQHRRAPDGGRPARRTGVLRLRTGGCARPGPVPGAPPGDRAVRVLVVRPDGMGDVLLTGPAVRAIAASGADVTFLAGPHGTGAAALLPGVNRVLEWRAPWIDPEPGAFDPGQVQSLVRRVRQLSPAVAVVFTSFHQSPLPMALALRMAGVPRIAAISEDYPGSLLDVRHPPTGDIPEAERNLVAGPGGRLRAAGR